MQRKHNLVGETFGRWHVAADDSGLTNNARTVVCQCKCGVVKSVRVVNLVSGGSKSCGCLRREYLAEMKRVAMERRRNA